MTRLYTQRAFILVFALLAGIVLAQMAAPAEAQCWQPCQPFQQGQIVAPYYGDFYECPNTTYIRPAPNNWGYGVTYGIPNNYEYRCPPTTTRYATPALVVSSPAAPMPAPRKLPESPTIKPLRYDAPVEPRRSTVPKPQLHYSPQPEDVSPNPIVAWR